MLRSAASLVLSAALLSSVSIAQTGPQNVGIYLSKNAVAISGVVCGFDCADPGNVVTVRAQVNDTIDVRVIGDLGQPAFLVVSLGTSGVCPGIVVPGVAHSLLASPWSLLFGGGIGALGPYRSGGCNNGVGLVLAGLQLPAVAQNATVTFQGLVFASGAPAFTRAIELTIW